jgi:hypothetical protein
LNHIVIPAVGESTWRANSRPEWLQTFPNGKLMMSESLQGISLESFSSVVVTVSASHVDQFSNEKVLTDYVKKNISNKATLHILESVTHNSVETVAKTISDLGLRGSLMVKDVDCCFNLESLSIGNFVCFSDLNNCGPVDPSTKSYIELDSTGSISNIVEKRVVSNLFCSGGYGFESITDYMDVASELLENGGPQRLYQSDIIYSMLLNGVLFKPLAVFGFVDWSTRKQFLDEKNNYMTIFIDFDGCIVENSSAFARNPWTMSPIESNIKQLQELVRQKNLQVIITTSRPDSERSRIESFMQSFGIDCQAILTGLYHSKRALINDYADSNPFPSAIAINVERNSRNLFDPLLSGLGWHD